MPAEYALGAAWHDRVIRERIIEMQKSYLLLMRCGTLIARVDKKATKNTTMLTSQCVAGSINF